MSNLTSTASTMQAETSLWYNRIVQNSSTGFEWASASIANNLVRVIKTKTYSAKVLYLLPFLGRGIFAARVPLLDVLNAGMPTNVGFVNADFSENTGLKGDGSSKYLDTLLKPGSLGAGSNGGIGYWERAIDFTGTGDEPMGCYNSTATNRYVITLRSGRTFASWGLPTNVPDLPTTAATNGHYYIQRSSATSRTLYKAGISVASNATSDVALGSTDLTIRVMGSNEGSNGSFYWKGTCSVAYLTDGTLTSDEVFDLHSVLQSNLIGPTGR